MAEDAAPVTFQIWALHIQFDLIDYLNITLCDWQFFKEQINWLCSIRNK